MPILQGQASEGMCTIQPKFRCGAILTPHSATRLGRNVPHAVFGMLGANTLHGQAQLQAPHLLESPHIALSKISQNCKALGSIRWGM
jgi:hypothetical protein